LSKNLLKLNILIRSIKGLSVGINTLNFNYFEVYFL